MELKPFGLIRMLQEIVMVRTRLVGGPSWIRTSVRFAGAIGPNGGELEDLGVAARDYWLTTPT